MRINEIAPTEEKSKLKHLKRSLTTKVHLLHIAWAQYNKHGKLTKKNN